MELTDLSLNKLRAFDSAARHLSFTRAAAELCVTQAAVSHQVKSLEEHLGAPLFRRTTRGLVLTDEGAALAPTVADAFGRIERGLHAIAEGGPCEVLTVGVVGTFAIGFLIERLHEFREQSPFVDLRVMTNNNKVDLWSERLDFAIRFGDGAWRGVQADLLMKAPMSPLCSRAIAGRLRQATDLEKENLLRSYRLQDWPAWLNAAGAQEVTARGPVFDASGVMVQAAIMGQGIALAPPAMFQRELRSGQLVQPFEQQVDLGAYWITRLLSKEPTPAMQSFLAWITEACGSTHE